MITIILALWGMARPLILLSVILVYMAGLLMARADGYPLERQPILWGFAALLLVALSIHYTNEYADYETDALTTPTLYSGGSGVLAQGKVPRQLALQAAWVSLFGGASVGVWGLTAQILTWQTLAILLAGGFFGWMYSLPPLKLAWRGWGELDNAILGGIFLHGFGYSVVTGTLKVSVILACVPFTLLVFNNLLATTWADHRADAQVGKNTLAVQWPVPRLRMLYGLCLFSALASLFFLHNQIVPLEVVLGSLLAVPLLLWGWFTYTRLHNPYPTSNGMVVFVIGQMVGWYLVGS